MTSLERSIIETIAYFDVFEYPLTSFEIWKWLYGGGVRSENTVAPIRLHEVQAALRQSEYLSRVIQSKQGMFFLQGKERYREVRAERFTLAEEKFRRAQRFARMVSVVPFVRMVAICNSLGYSNARKTSDIDFFIMTGAGRIWTARLLTVCLMKIFRLRPRKGHTENTLCFSFFLSEEHADVASVRLRTVAGMKREDDDDIYFTYWLAHVTPLYDERDYYEQWWNANKWIASSMPQVRSKYTSHRRRVDQARATQVCKRAGEWVLKGRGGDYGERIAKKIQKFIMPAQLRQLSETHDNRVVMNDEMLKMHYNDRRALYREMWHEKIEQVGQV